jgi:ESCRT-II complex subunit VPS22
MCAPLGVDPLLASKKSIWGQLLGGMSDYYYQLAVKVAEVCLASRSKNGGIMSMAECQAILAKRRTRLSSSEAVKQVSAADIQIAIQKLAKLGGGFRTIQVGSATMIVSVPTELDNDHMQVMTLATIERRGVTLEQVRDATGWSKERAERAVELLLQQGMAWVDHYQGYDYYWFPSVWEEIKNETMGEF